MKAFGFAIRHPPTGPHSDDKEPRSRQLCVFLFPCDVYDKGPMHPCGHRSASLCFYTAKSPAFGERAGTFQQVGGGASVKVFAAIIQGLSSHPGYPFKHLESITEPGRHLGIGSCRDYGYHHDPTAHNHSTARHYARQRGCQKTLPRPGIPPRRTFDNTGGASTARVL